jgi:hypothetical protein
MDTNQTAPPVAPTPVTASPGLFGSKIPSSVAYIVGVLLFFMPFIDIKCNNMSLQTVSGIQLATGFKMKNSSSDNSFLNDLKTDKADETITKTATKTDEKDPNLYAMVALGLGILGLLLSFTNAKAAVGGAMVAGIGAAGAMIGMMLDIKKKVKLDIPSTGGEKSDDGLTKGLENFGKDLTEKMNISVDFTPWFYVAVVAFLVAAFFCYKRMTSLKS